MRIMRAVFALTLALGLSAVLPDVVHACPVCFDSSDENRRAFLATTAFLSLLPLGMVFGAGVWIRHRSREMDERDGLEERSSLD